MFHPFLTKDIFAIPVFVAMPILISIMLLESALIARRESKYVRELTFIAFSILILLSSISIKTLASSVESSIFMGKWIPPFGIQILLNRSNLAIILLIAMTSLGFVCIETEYSILNPLILLLFIGLLGFFLTNDLFNMFVFMEITATASFGLAAISKKKDSAKAALFYLIPAGITTTLFFLSAAMVYGLAGTLNFWQISTKAIELGGFLAAGLLLPFIFKSPLIPLHKWKVNVVRNSSPQGILFFTSLSPLMAFYGFYKIFENFKVPLKLAYFLAFISGTTCVLASINASSSKDFLSSLVYCSIVNTSLALFALFLNFPGIAFMQIIATVLSEFVMITVYLKPNIFADRGEIPFLIALLSIAGMPFTPSFISKVGIITAFFSASQIFGLIACVVVVFSSIYIFNLYKCFEKREEHVKKARTIDIYERTLKYLIMGFIVSIFLLGIFQTEFYKISVLLFPKW